VITLGWNKINAISTRSFYNLSNVTLISLAGNRLNVLFPKSLTNLPNLEQLDLQHNRLREMSFNFMSGVASYEKPLTINASYNNLRRLHCSSITTPTTAVTAQVPVNISSIDLSYNHFTFVPYKCLSKCQATLKVLDLSDNSINRLDKQYFSSLRTLQTLAMRNNRISSLHNGAFEGLISLQILDLSDNKLGYLPLDVFKSLFRLRVLDLSKNTISAIPATAFQNTLLEKLNLAYNRLPTVPTQSLEPVSATLRHLDLARNTIDRLDSSSFSCCPMMSSLNLSYNR
jgi:Leucine-rich repeat (LRR) protein